MFGQIMSRIRRNHGLEHATIHVLSEKHTNFSAQGHSGHRGFHLNIYGNIGEQEIIQAVEEAYSRMKKGESQLAVHPNCGTVLLTTATLATLAAQLAFGMEQKRQNRSQNDVWVWLGALPTAVLAVVLSLIVSRPLGLYLQANYTTEGNLGDLELVRIAPVQPSLTTRVFQLLLTGGNTAVQTNSYFVETRG